jgi:hypothetical protein
MNQLPDEVLEEIIGHLYKEYHLMDNTKRSPLNKWIHTLAFVNRHMRRITLPMLYHAVRIFTLNQMDGLLLRLIQNPEYGDLVRRLKIEEMSKAVGSLIFYPSFSN